MLARNHGHRYYNWAYEDGVFRSFEHPVHVSRLTRASTLFRPRSRGRRRATVGAIGSRACAFANPGSTCGRSITADHRVEAHIFAAALAFLIHRAIEKKLKAAGLDLSAADALKTVRVVDIALGDGSTQCIEGGRSRLRDFRQSPASGSPWSRTSLWRRRFAGRVALLMRRIS
jgi:hypothetical protein